MKLPSPLRLSSRRSGASSPDRSPDGSSWGTSVGGDAELERLLGIFADATLSPNDEALTRGRAALLSAIAVRAEVAADSGKVATGQAGITREPLRSKLWLRRVSRERDMGPSFARPGTSMRPRLVAATVAVGLMLVTVVGVAAETGPGQPFYRVRLNVEAIGLPAAGSTARAEADLSRAEARLGEISGKMNGDDWNAAADAADAYEQVVVSMASPAPNKTNDAYRQGLRDQLDHLLTLRTHSQGKESKALDKAIARLEALLGLPPSATPAPTPAPTDNPGKGHGNGGGNGNGNGNGGGGGSGQGNGNGGGQGGDGGN